MPKPACIKCQRFLRPKKNGYILTEMKPKGYGMKETPQGNSHPEMWEPYLIWNCDLWECQGCGIQIATGYAEQPNSRDYFPDFEKELKKSQSNINDC